MGTRRGRGLGDGSQQQPAVVLGRPRAALGGYWGCSPLGPQPLAQVRHPSPPQPQSAAQSRGQRVLSGVPGASLRHTSHPGQSLLEREPSQSHPGGRPRWAPRARRRGARPLTPGQTDGEVGRKREAGRDDGAVESHRELPRSGIPAGRAASSSTWHGRRSEITQPSPAAGLYLRPCMLSFDLLTASTLGAAPLGTKTPTSCTGALGAAAPPPDQRSPPPTGLGGMQSPCSYPGTQ